jgi:2-polyprenyl-6-methoxyphenol hydroxylase-like FAD-dependent oxidoreductase
VDRVQFSDPQIAVLGDGTAGCCAILALRKQGLDPLWIHPEQSRSHRTWVETVDAQGIEILNGLLDADALLERCSLPIAHHHSCWGSDRLISHGQARLTQSSRGSHLIDKGRWRQGLQELASAASTAVPGRVRRIEPDAKGFQLRLGSGQTRPCQGLILATGTNSSWAKTLSGSNCTDVLLGCHWILRQPAGHQSSEEGATLLEAYANGWWYAVSLPGGRLSLLLFRDPGDHQTGPGSSRDLREQLNQSKHLKRWVRDQHYCQIEHSQVFHHHCRSLDHYGGTAPGSAAAAWVAIGDAAISHDPLSSFGLTSGLWSAKQAASRITQYLAREQPEAIQSYDDDLRRLYNNTSKTRQSLYAQEHRFSSEPFWIRRRITS